MYMHSGGVTQMKNNLIAILLGLLFAGGLIAGCSGNSDDSSGGTGTGTDSGAGQTEPEKPVVDTDAGSSAGTGSTDAGTTDTGTTDTGTTDSGSSEKTEGDGGTGM
jgi:hypothetical protein